MRSTRSTKPGRRSKSAEPTGSRKSTRSNKSFKQISLEKKILKRLPSGSKVLRAAELLLDDEEVQYLQDYANTISIRRLHYNDHGPVHMRKVALNSLVLVDLLNRAGIKFSLEKEGIGSFEDSKIAVLTASLLHDVGMSVGRENHESSGAMLSMPIIERLLNEIYPNDLRKRVILRSLVMEGIMGHMGTQKTFSLEGGIILVADGCDMEQGRARIPMLYTESKVGDIHKYSSSEIKKVSIEEGEERPIRITISMSGSVGFFQVEEVLMRKISASSIQPYIELYAGVIGQDKKCYL